ncbi:MAG: glycosyltransferase involved in cell wall biosynthesis [Parasphingorhabdus sp.]|jgi:glycosyltransferase involved in cell wall biosynthesis
MEKSISIVIPVFNERRTIREIIKKVQSVPRDKEIIIVDDHSTDGTRRILKEYTDVSNIRLFLQPKNKGKGAALHYGFQQATKEIVIVQDADLEYDPADIERLLRPIENGHADVVYGSRLLHGERRVLYYWHYLGNKVLTGLSNLFTNINLTDMETCYKAFKREIIQNIQLSSERFGFEPEITAKISRLQCSIYEVPINYYGRSYAEGKKITWRDGVAAFYFILKFALIRNPERFVKDRQELNQCLAQQSVQIDVGVRTLEAFVMAPKYNAWIFSRFKKHVGKHVLEIGSGIGNIVSELLTLPHLSKVIASDISADSLNITDDRFGDDERVSIVQWDAGVSPPAAIAESTYDTIVSLNVLEHIEDHVSTLAEVRQLLNPGGKLILLVPAHQALYCGLDEDLDHYRRYSKKGLTQLLEQSGFTIIDQIEHNFVGVIGWYWVGIIRKRRALATQDTKIFDLLVPLLRHIDPLLTRLFCGISFIVVASPNR